MVIFLLQKVFKIIILFQNAKLHANMIEFLHELYDYPARYLHEILSWVTVGKRWHQISADLINIYIEL